MAVPVEDIRYYLLVSMLVFFSTTERSVYTAPNEPMIMASTSEMPVAESKCSKDMVR